MEGLSYEGKVYFTVTIVAGLLAIAGAVVLVVRWLAGKGQG